MTLLFDIVFQNGEFFYEASSSILEKIWTFLASFIGLGIPLLLFYLGLKEDKKREIKRKNDRQNDNLKYFAILVENVIIVCNKQAGNCMRIAEESASHPTEFPIIEKVVGTDIKRIVNLVNHENIFHAYVSKFGNKTEKIKEFRTIFSYLDYLDKTYDQHIFDYENFKQKFDSIFFEYKILSEELMDYVTSLIRSIKKENPDNEKDDFLNFIDELILYYYKELKNKGIEKDMNYDFENFIDPIKKELIRKYRDVKYTDYITIQAKKATYKYNDLINLSKSINIAFEEFKLVFFKIEIKLKGQTEELMKINAT